MTQHDRSILVVTCFGHFLSHFNMLVFPALLLPLSQQFQLPLEKTLGMSFMMYLLFGITAFPWGVASDRFGPRRMLFFFFLGAGVCGMVAALTVSSPVGLTVSLAGIGLFSGIYHPAGLGWIAKSIEKTSRAMAYNGIFGNLGLALAPLCAGLVNYFFGVKAAYILLGMLNLSGVLLLWKTKNGAAISHQPVERPHNRQGAIKPFCILLVAMMLGGIVYRGTSVTLPAYFELNNSQLFDFLKNLFGNIGSPNVVATICTSSIYFIGMVGQYVGGRVGESYDLSKGYLLFHIMTVPAAILMAMTTNVPLLFFAVIHSFFLLGMQPIENTLVARLTPPKVLSSAYGLKFILTFGVGAFSVKSIELIQRMWGIDAIFFSLAAVSSLLVLVIVLLILTTKNKSL